MQVNVRTDNHIAGRERLASYITSVVEDTLSHFRQRITRVEVHLSDANGHKPGADDKRCVMEVRLEGQRPIAVSHSSGSVDEAISGTASKLRRLVNDTLRRKRDN
ncbi:MAG: HPF/RaiA family ribosome-associated protein [Candidatus Hydrogenedentes bacterium]|nr:HPF/RaiA family ribosome-associated protein [Candidatus Hydrogenedentota bacterium]